MPFVIPVGIDFADGETLLPAQPYGSSGTPLVIGTSLPTANISFFSSSGFGNSLKPTDIEEPPGSPEIERAEQCTCSHTLKMSWAQCLQYWSVMGRGVVVNDTAANIWRILSCKIKRLEATTGELSYVMESISFDSPPDDFSLNEVSLDLNIIKHPRYAWALNPYVTDNSTYTLVGNAKIYYTQQKEAIIRMIQNYIDSPFYPSAAQVQGLIQSSILSCLSPNGSTGYILVNVGNPNYVQPANNKVISEPQAWDGTAAQLLSIPTSVQTLVVSVPYNPADTTNPIVIAVAAAKELISKLWRQEDTPYIAGYEIKWSQYYFQPVYLNPGGYIEDPRDYVPQYFICPDNNGIIPRAYQFNNFGGDTSSPPLFGQSTIFDYLTYFNPQCYSVTGLSGGELAMSCLRKSDRYEYERTWFKVDHTWLCAPAGKWDSDIYTQYNRPQDANDYNVLPTQFGQ